MRKTNPIRALREFFKWQHRDFSGQSPHFIKQGVLARCGVKDGTWIETGTFRGATTAYLRALGARVYTIEPAQYYFERAEKRFKADPEVTVLNGTSEEILPVLLAKLNGNLNFWLDGHYSAGKTFEGESHCPVVSELEAIERNLGSFGQVAILIDDVRCFGSDDPVYADYPSLDYLVDWCRKHKFDWRIEHDIFIARNF